MAMKNQRYLRVCVFLFCVHVDIFVECMTIWSGELYNFTLAADVSGRLSWFAGEIQAPNGRYR